MKSPRGPDPRSNVSDDDRAEAFEATDRHARQSRLVG
jgi:hypothetical protein